MLFSETCLEFLWRRFKRTFLGQSSGSLARAQLQIAKVQDCDAAMAMLQEKLGIELETFALGSDSRLPLYSHYFYWTVLGHLVDIRQGAGKPKAAAKAKVVIAKDFP